MAQGTTTASTIQSDAQTYIAAELLSRIKRDTIVYAMSKKEKLPNRFSTTFQFTRYNKLNLPNTTLTEGTTPANGSQLAITTVSCVMDQWGDFVTLTDVAQITAKHPALEQAIVLLSEQAKELIDRECIKVLLANANVVYPGVATRALVTTTTFLTSTAVKVACAALRRGGAWPISGRLYQGLMDPSVEMDLLTDTTFLNAAQYSNIMALMNGEAGTWMGTRWVTSNIIPTLAALATMTTASATGGSLTNSTSYFVQVVQRDALLGFVTGTTQVLTQATAGGGTAITVVLPNVANVLYDVYFGAASTTCYLSSSLNAPNQTITILAVPAISAAPPAPPAAGVTIHYSWIMGKDAFAAPELQSLETFITPATSSDSDPLVQRRKVAWKFMFKPVICNDVYIERIESASAF